jgi:hypothetical protein
LDDELRKAEEASRHSKMSMKPSPFELSGESKSRKPDSSEFDLPPAKKSGSALDSSSEEIALDIGSSDVNDLLTAADSDLTVQAESSGISLHDPSDKGIALDESDETINFDLSVEESPAATPNPSARSPKAKPSPKAKAADSSSEFELTLEDEGAAAPVKKKGRTDMVVPGLEESDIGLKTEDSDLGSSDFELALEGEEVGSESESGSEVIVLDDAGEGDATAVAPPGDLEGEEITEIVDEAPPSDLEAGDEVEVAAEDEGVTVPAGVAAPPAEWGWWSLVHVPTALVLIFVGFLMFEMLRSIWSYGQPSTLGGVVFNFFDKHMK